jgi:TRAP-type C4-dicarboxylate transport system substrate-binding protein
MKRFFRFRVFWILVTPWLPASGTAEAADKPIKLATLATNGTSFHKVLLEMGQQWGKAPGSGTRVNVYAGSAMGSEAALVSRMRLGQLQAALLSVSGLVEIDPDAAALQIMPMMFRNLQEVEYVRSRLEPRLGRQMADKGFIVLFWADAGWVRFFSRQKALVPSDYRKLKVFVEDGALGSHHVDIMKHSGFQPVPLEWSALLSALQTGMVDAVPTAPFHSLGGQFYTVARHMTEVNWVALVGGMVFERKSWDSLASETRDAFRAAAEDAGRRIQARGRLESDEAVASMKQRGLQVHPLTPAQEQEWRDVAEGFYPKIRGSMVPAEVFDDVRRWLVEYRTRR